MKGWQITAGLTGLALGALVVAPRLPGALPAAPTDAAPAIPIDDVAAITQEHEPQPAPRPLFQPDLPLAPRRATYRSSALRPKETSNGRVHEAVRAASAKHCAESLTNVQHSMGASFDYAGHYDVSWLCFTDAHQRPLMQANVETWEDFRTIIPNFEGTPEATLTALAANPELKHVPPWFRPAVDGIEFRLEKYGASNSCDRMVEVLNDHFGELTIADHLARDLYLVLLAASGLARVDAPSEEVQQWWARRVYVGTIALNGGVGRTVDKHRNEFIPLFHDLLREATKPQLRADGTLTVVPEVVLQAHAVALENAPGPSTKAAPKPVCVKSGERILEDPTPLDEGDIIGCIRCVHSL